MSSLENFNRRYTQTSGLAPAGRAALAPCPIVRRLDTAKAPALDGLCGGRESQPCDRSGARAGGSTAAQLLVLSRSEANNFSEFAL